MENLTKNYNIYSLHKQNKMFQFDETKVYERLKQRL